MRPPFYGSLAAASSSAHQRAAKYRRPYYVFERTDETAWQVSAHAEPSDHTRLVETAGAEYIPMAPGSLRADLVVADGEPALQLTGNAEELGWLLSNLSGLRDQTCTGNTAIVWTGTHAELVDAVREAAERAGVDVVLPGAAAIADASIVMHGADGDGKLVHGDGCRMCVACRGFARAS